MAAPVVTGVAALVMSYYPNLSASDVRKIIIASTAKYPAQIVNARATIPRITSRSARSPSRAGS